MDQAQAIASVARYFGMEETATLESVKRAVYKGTDCGAWINVTDTHLCAGSIVEGSDAEITTSPLDLACASDAEIAAWLDTTLPYIEAEAHAAWLDANPNA